ncbi:hypothetical protein CXG81DRAFT_24170 [Caulochytrium protostelioides]|uniref:Cell division control protein 73 C-terminal domain-containing protein n=1 Tax=Caulochytrium protostelioides TaxID=1555241 RepID=A0A4V1IV84_9FUNG|nr:hypothetical protein CXG81DRAFT_24170 [Caulochytrium protostelioides]|eukprot:RKP03169.1 hypothetical protein CXG81DRAFT_24170 [Caulochytrium protostelioides]
MPAPAAAITALRESHVSRSGYRLLSPSGDPQPLGVASTIVFGPAEDRRIALSDASGFKGLPLEALVLLYENRQLNWADYMKVCVAKSAEFNREFPNIAHRDYQPVKDYLEGTTKGLEGLESTVASGGNPECDEIFSLVAKVKAGTKRKALDAIEAYELPTMDRSSILCVKGSKGLVSLRRSALMAFRKVAGPDGKGAPEHTRSGSASASASRAPSRVPTASMSRTPSGSASAAAKDPKRIPIIVVPSAPQATITLINAKDFLVENRWVPVEEKRKAGESVKPQSVMIERDAKNTPPGLPRQYLVVDSVSRLAAADWSRVVAVFVTGQAWQLKGWKWKEPVEIFHHVKGFCLKLRGDPLPPAIAQWNVKILEIHPNQRHLDMHTSYEFWRQIDSVLRK